MLLEGVKDVIVATFGLNLPNRIDPAGGMLDPAKMTEEERKAFTPFAFLVAHRELLKKFFDHQQQEEVAIKALGDEAFDKLSRQVQKELTADGDMVPMGDNKPPDTDDPKKLDEWLAQMNLPVAPPKDAWIERNQEELKNAGVIVTGQDMAQGNTTKKITVKVDEDG